MLTNIFALVIAAAMNPSLANVYFRFDSSALPSSVAIELQEAATYAAAHPSARLVLDAHCDPIGTAPYNVGLAIRRAESVRTELVLMGVPESQIVVAVYGEDGAKRATFAQDRRVTVWAAKAPMAEVIDKTFAAQGTAVTWGK